MKISAGKDRIKPGARIQISRLLIGLVTFINLLCALVFLIEPARYAPAFELAGRVGEIVISSLGILFIMWNIPYLFALVHPIKYRVSLLQAILMQAFGFIAESVLWMNIDAIHHILRGSIFRFILFDGMGLLLLLVAFAVSGRRIPPAIRPA